MNASSDRCCLWCACLGQTECAGALLGLSWLVWFATARGAIGEAWLPALIRRENASRVFIKRFENVIKRCGWAINSICRRLGCILESFLTRATQQREAATHRCSCRRWQGVPRLFCLCGFAPVRCTYRRDLAPCAISGENAASGFYQNILHKKQFDHRKKSI